MNGNSAPRDVYDKKRKLMETLDNFGVRKRTRQEVCLNIKLYDYIYSGGSKSFQLLSKIK